MHALSFLVFIFFVATTGLVARVAGHASPFHPSMYGFNVTAGTFNYDNRPVVPLYNRKFNDWWFHGFLDYPPHPNDVFHLPAGGVATLEIACNKGATSYYASSEGGDIRSGNNPCPGSPISEFHTTGRDNVKGCALAISSHSNARDVQPDDFVVFSVNHTCVWNRFTDFHVPDKMPPCPGGKCTCMWGWIHSPQSGSEQMYMIGFQCDVINSKSNTPIAKGQLARRCGADPDTGTPAHPDNCTVGAKLPLYWLQSEGNNMHEGYYSPPYYNDLYGFKDGAQTDIFVTSGAQTPDSTPSKPKTTIKTASKSTKTAMKQGSSSSTPSATPASIVGHVDPLATPKSPNICKGRKRYLARKRHRRSILRVARRRLH